MKDVGAFEIHRFIGHTLLVHQEGKGDPGLFAEQCRIRLITQSDGGKPGTCGLEVLLIFAQLRDMLTAEYSAIVPEKNKNGRSTLPKRAEAHVGSGDIRENDTG